MEHAINPATCLKWEDLLEWYWLFVLNVVLFSHFRIINSQDIITSS